MKTMIAVLIVAALSGCASVSVRTDGTNWTARAWSFCKDIELPNLSWTNGYPCIQGYRSGVSTEAIGAAVGAAIKEAR